MIQPARMAVSTTAPAKPTLRRALGRWDLTAIGVNQVIGGAIFLMPAQVAAQIGGWSPIGFVLMGLASMSVALCFAEVGSRFEGTGGPYLYARAAFGSMAGFEVGWLLWLARITSFAALLNLFVTYLAGLWPGADSPPWRGLIITTVIAALTAVN